MMHGQKNIKPGITLWSVCRTDRWSLITPTFCATWRQIYKGLFNDALSTAGWNLKTVFWNRTRKFLFSAYRDIGYSRTLVTIQQYIAQHPRRLDTSHYRPENLTSCWRQNIKSHVQLWIWRRTRAMQWGV